ncbi:YitT family protein [Candidatus Babeliales bacterium]|nr:YitT family protein [Candidatus Babeliales bacterium]
MKVFLKTKKVLNILNFFEYALLMLGCLILALTFNLFLCPNNLASGGLPGLSIILKKILCINAAYIQYLINLPIFLVGLFILGKNFCIKTIAGTIAMPGFILLTQKIPVFNNNILIAAILGGVGTGIGLGLIFKSKSALCGFSLLTQILHKYTSFKLSSLTLLLNAAVIILAGFTFGFSGAFYALLSLSVTCSFIEITNLFL